MSLAPRAITDEAQLREIVGAPAGLVVSKIADRLNPLTRQFVERSPFVCVATARPDGGLDVSPRGDPAGFVRILDERTLLMPDRPGNRIADTLTNLLADDRIGLLFLIPGIGDTFRVNGRASIVDDPEALAPSAMHGARVCTRRGYRLAGWPMRPRFASNTACLEARGQTPSVWRRGFSRSSKRRSRRLRWCRAQTASSTFTSPATSSLPRRCWGG